MLFKDATIIGFARRIRQLADRKIMLQIMLKGTTGDQNLKPQTWINFHPTKTQIYCIKIMPVTTWTTALSLSDFFIKKA